MLSSPATGTFDVQVSGESMIYRLAERAVMFISVSSDGTSQADVSRDVTVTSSELRSIMLALAAKSEDGQPAPEAPVTYWMMTSISTGSYQPVSDDGSVLPRQYTASTRFETKFRDFARLSTFATALSVMEHVSITSIEWRLTDATKGALGRQSRQDAVTDAIRKAQDLADVIGKNELKVTSISGGYESTSFEAPVMLRSGLRKATAFGDSAADELSLEPQTVTLSSSAEVKFLAKLL